MLSIKSTPQHKFSIFIELSENINPDWCLGRMDKNGNFIQDEVECTIDGTSALVKLHDYFKKTVQELPLLSFILKLGYGFDGKECQKLLYKKYGNKINHQTNVTIILYQLLEIA